MVLDAKILKLAVGYDCALAGLDGEVCSLSNISL